MCMIVLFQKWGFMEPLGHQFIWFTEGVTFNAEIQMHMIVTIKVC